MKVDQLIDNTSRPVAAVRQMTAGTELAGPVQARHAAFQADSYARTSKLAGIQEQAPGAIVTGTTRAASPVSADLDLARAAYKAKYYENATLALQKALADAAGVEDLLRVAETANSMPNVEFGPQMLTYQALEKAIAASNNADQLVQIAKEAKLLQTLDQGTEAFKKAVDLAAGTDQLLRIATAARRIADVAGPHLALRKAISTETSVDELLVIAETSAALGGDLQDETRAALRQAILLSSDAPSARHIADVAEHIGCPQEARDALDKATGA